MSLDSQFWRIRNTAWGGCFAQFDRLGKFGCRKWPWELPKPSQNLYTRCSGHSAETALSTEQVPWGILYVAWADLGPGSGVEMGTMRQTWDIHSLTSITNSKASHWRHDNWSRGCATSLTSLEIGMPGQSCGSQTDNQTGTMP